MVFSDPHRETELWVHSHMTYSCRFGVEVVSINQILLPQSVALSTITTGRIFVDEQLDRETRDSYQLTLMAVDISDSPLSAILPILITVLDTNDNLPTFTQPLFNFTLRENINNVLIMNFSVGYVQY